jgi:hypothetical protein
MGIIGVSQRRWRVIILQRLAERNWQEPEAVRRPEP